MVHSLFGFRRDPRTVPMTTQVRRAVRLAELHDATVADAEFTRKGRCSFTVEDGEGETHEVDHRNGKGFSCTCQPHRFFGRAPGPCAHIGAALIYLEEHGDRRGNTFRITPEDAGLEDDDDDMFATSRYHY